MRTPESFNRSKWIGKKQRRKEKAKQKRKARLERRKYFSENINEM